MSSSWNERVVRRLCLACVAISLSCNTYVTNTYIDDGASDGARVSRMIDASEAATLTLKNGARLDVPAGSVRQPVRLALERVPDARASALVRATEPTLKPLGAPHILTPHGTRFDRGVDLQLPLNALPATGRRLAVVWLEDEDDQAWKRLDEPDVTGVSVKVVLKHFSVVMLAELEDGAELDTPNGGVPATDAAVEDVPDDGAVGDGAAHAATDAGRDAAMDAAADAATTDVDAAGSDGSASLDASVGTGQDAEAGMDACTRDGAVCCGAPRRQCTAFSGAISSLAPGCARDWQDAEVCGISSESLSNLDAGIPPFVQKQAPGAPSPSCGDLLDLYDAIGDAGRWLDAGTVGNQRLDTERIIGAAAILLSRPACCTPGGICSLDTDRGRAVVGPGSAPLDSNAGYGCLAPAWAFPTLPEAQQVACDPVTGVRTGALP